MRYERKAHQLLSYNYEGRYLQSAWIEFEDESGLRWCQPDGLIFDLNAGRITIVEIKLSHTADAFYQLMYLYLPVIEAMFPRKLWKINLTELVRWYDKDTYFPYPTQLRKNIEDSEPGFIGIHIRDL